MEMAVLAPDWVKEVLAELLAAASAQVPALLSAAAAA
jgi:hypothetical protein